MAGLGDDGGMLRTFRLTTLAVVVATSALLGACGGQKAPTPTTPTTGAAATTAGSPAAVPGAGMLSGITVHRTGGIAGADETLVVAPAGTWTYVNKKTGATEKGAFTPEQGLGLAQIASDPGLTQQIADSASAGVCNDGFTYAIDVSGKS